MRRVIRLGDLTTHGGRVVQATERYTMDGIPVARLGDHCTCPIPGHAGCVIVEGDPNWTIDGKPVALEGHLTSCGAALISTFGRLERRFEGNGEKADSRSLPTANAKSDAAKSAAANTFQAGRRFHVKDSETRKPIQSRPFIAVVNGVERIGITDERGYADIEAEEGDDVRIHVQFTSPAALLHAEVKK